MSRGREIARRRKRHDIHSVQEFARRTELDRKTIYRIEDGQASEPTYDKIEQWLDDLDRTTGVDSRQEAPPPAPEIKFDVTGPRTAWHVVVSGPPQMADELRRQVTELLRDTESLPED